MLVKIQPPSFSLPPSLPPSLVIWGDVIIDWMMEILLEDSARVST